MCKLPSTTSCIWDVEPCSSLFLFSLETRSDLWTRPGAIGSHGISLSAVDLACGVSQQAAGQAPQLREPQSENHHRRRRRRHRPLEAWTHSFSNVFFLRLKEPVEVAEDRKGTSALCLKSVWLLSDAQRREQTSQAERFCGAFGGNIPARM